MKIIYNVKHRCAIPWKFGGKFLTSQTKLVLEAKTSIGSTIKESLLLYSLKYPDICCRCHNLTYFYSNGVISVPELALK